MAEKENEPGREQAPATPAAKESPLGDATRVWTAGLVVIGDEILSGHTQDANIAYVARWLNVQGIRLKEVRVVPDDAPAIGTAVKACLDAFDYVFTTGGIGPTHDDITVDAIAAALGLKVVYHPNAVATLKAYYGDRLTDVRLRMARVPEGAELLENPETGAPGIRLDRLFIMAGVPTITQGMLRGLDGKLAGGRAVKAVGIGAWVGESQVAALLADIQFRYAGVQIGSYPFWREGKSGANFVLRSVDGERLKIAAQTLFDALMRQGINAQMGEI